MNTERLLKVLVSPLVSEKSSLAAEKVRQYVFRVLPDTNKREIARAVEMLFKVQVEQVQVANVKGKKKRFGRMMGKRSDWKKAYVKLKPGYEIQMGT